MIKQVLLPILGVIVFIVAVGLFVRKSGSLNLSGAISASPTPAPATITLGKSQKLQVVVAKTKESRIKGLSGTTSLGENNGMLFTFDTQNTNPVFWMKDMVIPLDIIWINDNKIVKIDKSVPAPKPGTPDNKLATYSAGQPIDYVLEVNAGYSNSNFINVGNSVDLSSI